MNYLIKFDNDGRRSETHDITDQTQEQIQAMIDDGFEIVSEEDYQLLLGNVDGKEYVKNSDGTYSEYIPPLPTIEALKIVLEKAVEGWLDETVQQRRYKDIVTACSYAASTDHIFAAEGIACVKWRDAVWRKYFDVLAEIEAGTREFSTVEDLLAELPVLEW